MTLLNSIGHGTPEFLNAAKLVAAFCVEALARCATQGGLPDGEDDILGGICRRSIDVIACLPSGALKTINELEAYCYTVGAQVEGGASE